jgi:nucleotide-binding universal stress UspA family protein
MVQHLLLPTDGSELSAAAAAQAVSLAQSCRAKMTVIHVLPAYLVSPFGAYGPEDEFARKQFDENARKAADGYFAPILQLARDAGVACEAQAVDSEFAYEGIIRIARELGCDLIFMASHGRRGIAGVLMGSETQKVLTHSRIPVLVYR